MPLSQILSQEPASKIADISQENKEIQLGDSPMTGENRVQPQKMVDQKQSPGSSNQSDKGIKEIEQMPGTVLENQLSNNIKGLLHDSVTMDETSIKTKDYYVSLDGQKNSEVEPLKNYSHLIIEPNRAEAIISDSILENNKRNESQDVSGLKQILKERTSEPMIVENAEMKPTLQYEKETRENIACIPETAEQSQNTTEMASKEVQKIGPIDDQDDTQSGLFEKSKKNKYDKQPEVTSVCKTDYSQAKTGKQESHELKTMIPISTEKLEQRNLGNKTSSKAESDISQREKEQIFTTKEISFDADNFEELKSKNQDAVFPDSQLNVTSQDDNGLIIIPNNIKHDVQESLEIKPILKEQKKQNKNMDNTKTLKTLDIKEETITDEVQ